MNKFEKELILADKLENMKQYENSLYSQGLKNIAGVDEVGRGPLAGPVVTAAVVLQPDFSILGVDDSKKLSEKKREFLYDQIMEQAVAIGIGWVDNVVIDEINILEATKLAMKQSILEVEKKLIKKGFSGLDHVLIDAVKLDDIKTPSTSIIKGDANSVSIAAASIVAKVIRDRYMKGMSEKYPYYSFEKNKGYGTKAHYEGISQYGITEIHRRSFLKKFLNK